jgi:hypothetical protein
MGGVGWGIMMMKDDWMGRMKGRMKMMEERMKMRMGMTTRNR